MPCEIVNSSFFKMFKSLFESFKTNKSKLKFLEEIRVIYKTLEQLKKKTSLRIKLSFWTNEINWKLVKIFIY